MTRVLRYGKVLIEAFQDYVYILRTAGIVCHTNDLP
jgi:hypothetical protein